MKRSIQQSNMFEHMLRTANAQSKMKVVKQPKKPIESVSEEPKIEEPKVEKEPEQPIEEIKPQTQNNKKQNKPNE